MRLLLITLAVLSAVGCGRLSDNDSSGGDRLINEKGPDAGQSTDTPPGAESADYDMQELVPLGSLKLTLSPDRVQSSSAVDITGFKQILIYGSESFTPFACTLNEGFTIKRVKFFNSFNLTFGLTDDVSTHRVSSLNSYLYDNDFSNIVRRFSDGNWLSIKVVDKIEPSTPGAAEPAIEANSCVGEVTLNVVGIR
jgi:hypothetical protein